MVVVWLQFGSFTEAARAMTEMTLTGHCINAEPPPSAVAG
jgi:hypothetical protein